MKTSTKMMGVGILSTALATAMFAGLSNTTRTAVAMDDKAPAAAAPAVASGTYSVDTVHSNVLFRIKHMNTSFFWGRFNDFGGTFTMGETAGVNITVKAASVDSQNKKRDEHIGSNDFFSTAEFPEIKLVAADLKKSGDGFSGKAELTFRGVTKPVELTLTPTGTGKNRGGKDIVGFEAKFTFKRSDFGNSYMVGQLSDEVMILGSIQGAKQ